MRLGAAVVLALSLSAGAQSPALRPLARLWHGTLHLPRAALRHVRVAAPLVAGTAALVLFADAPASRRISNRDLESDSRAWSNRGLLILQPGILLLTASLHARCLFCRPVGRVILDAGATEIYATASVQALKFAAGRERPYTPGDGDGGFNESGSSFPSGHALGSFALAAYQSSRYPASNWADAAAYASAVSVAGARFTAKEHYLSDLVVGATLGVLIGRCEVTCP